MEVWRVAIGNDCWSFSSFNSDDICVWVDWTKMAKENFAISFPKVVKNSDVCNFGIIVSKNVFSMLWNCFVNTKLISFISSKIFMNILPVEFIKVDGFKWLQMSSIQDVNCGKYLFTISFFSSFQFWVYIYIYIYCFCLLILTYYYLVSCFNWWGWCQAYDDHVINTNYSSLNLDILDNFFLVLSA